MRLLLLFLIGVPGHDFCQAGTLFIQSTQELATLTGYVHDYNNRLVSSGRFTAMFNPPYKNEFYTLVRDGRFVTAFLACRGIAGPHVLLDEV